jgi:hypothetical protein
MAQEQHCSTPLLAKEFLGLEDMNPAERVTQGNTAALHGEHHDRGVKGDPRYLGPRRRVPDPRRAIAGTGDDAGAVGGEGGAQHNVLVAKNFDLGPRRRVPDPHRNR